MSYECDVLTCRGVSLLYSRITCTCALAFARVRSCVLPISVYLYFYHVSLASLVSPLL